MESLRPTSWNDFWWRPATPESLAACRILFYGLVLLLYGAEDFRFVVPLSEIRWQPVGISRWLSPEGPPSPAWIAGLQWAWRAALAASLVGLATPLASAIAFALGLYLISLPYAVSTIAHESAAMVLALGVMACARPADAASIDHVLRGSPAVPPSAEYRWPVALVRVVLSLAFFTAGASKLGTSGLEWITSDHVRMVLAERELPLAAPIVASPLAGRVLAGLTVAIETCHPLALVSPALALVLVPAGLALLGGIFLFMGVPFWPLVATHVFWIPWDRLRRRTG